MSAVVCGKRSLFEETLNSPAQKRLRCGAEGGSPSRLLVLRTDSSTVDAFPQLKALFPDMDHQMIERVLVASGNNLDYAIRSLRELQLSSEGSISSHLHNGTNPSQKVSKVNAENECQPVDEESSTDNANHRAPVLVEETKWVDLFVQQMVCASHLDDAKLRATKALEAFEKDIISRRGSLSVDFQKENAFLKEQLQCLVRDNHILKRAVAIQHERQGEYQNSLQELQEMKQLVVQYQEQIRNLEMNNYALNLHLRKAQDRSSMPGHFHPDVF